MSCPITDANSDAWSLRAGNINDGRCGSIFSDGDYNKLGKVSPTPKQSNDLFPKTSVWLDREQLQADQQTVTSDEVRGLGEAGKLAIWRPPGSPGFVFGVPGLASDGHREVRGVRLSTVQSLGHSTLPDQLLCVRSGAGHWGHRGGQGGTVDVESGRVASFQHLRAGAEAAVEVGSGRRDRQASTWVSSASRI